MFGFGRSRHLVPEGDIFSLDEIQQLIAEFPPSKEPGQECLIKLGSGRGFTSRNAILKAFGRLLDAEVSRVEISTLEKHLDVPRDLIIHTIRSEREFVTSRSGNEIITHSGQKQLIQALNDRANTGFVAAGLFAEERDIDLQSLAKLLQSSDTFGDGAPLQLVDSQGAPMARSAELNTSYIHTLSVLLAMREQVAQKTQQARKDSKICSWGAPEMLGLHKHTFCRLAERLNEDTNTVEDAEGVFSVSNDLVCFIPNTYLLSEAKSAVLEVAAGTRAFCDLKALAQQYPSLLPDIESAERFAEQQCLSEDGTAYRWHFIASHAIGDAGLNNTAQKCFELLASQRYLDTTPFASSFPPEVRTPVLELLHDRMQKLYRICGGTASTLLELQEYLIYTSLTSDLALASRRLARGLADECWDLCIEKPSLTATRTRTLLLERLNEESGAPLPLLQKLWSEPRLDIETYASSAFTQRLAELESDLQSQFRILWQERVAMPAKIHQSGLQTIPSGALYDQLLELLNIHLCQERIPSALKRIRSKNLARGPAAQRNLTKLEAALRSESASDLSASLATFCEKLGIPEPSEKQLRECRDRLVSQMAQAAQTDTDAPRLFLTTVLLLLAAKQMGDVGVVYATGKFAPRLLKLLKARVSEEQYASLERLKDAVKAGTVSDGDRAELRAFAAEAARESLGNSGVSQTP